MHVDGVNPGNGQAIGLAKLQAKENNGEDGVPEPTVSNETGEDTATVQTSDLTTESGEELPGVIRHLMDGHYNGVSDVRLRINFDAELEAIEAAERQAVAEEQIGQILELVAGAGDVEGPIASVGAVETEAEEPGPTVAELDGVAELQETFANEVNDAKERFLSASASSTDELVGDLWATFDVFVDSLLELYPPAEEAPVGEAEPADGSAGEEGAVEVVADGAIEGDGDIGGEGEGVVAVAEPEPEPGPDVQGYIEDLEAAFSAAVNELVEALGNVSVLPELSEPNGNGAAYEKFVAIYNELQGVAETGTVDVVG